MDLQEHLSKQYRNSSALDTRIRFHQQYSTNKAPWMRWVFERFDFPDPARVLEIGCGPGLLWKENADRIKTSWRITLSDRSEGMLSKAKENTSNLIVPFAYDLFPVETIPYEDDSFDAVIANHMLYYADPLDQALSEIRRVLKPGGALYASTNGITHLVEIDEIATGYGGGEKLIGPIIGRFNLEDGFDLLSPHFESAALYRRQDALLVDDPGAITAYILSGTRAELTGADEPGLTAYISEKMIQSGGYIRITKDAGLFAAQKSSPWQKNY